MSQVEDGDRNWTAPWSLIGVIAVLFCVLAVLARMVATLPGDEEVTTFVQGAHGWLPRAITDLGSGLGTTITAILGFAVMLGFTVIRRWRRDMWFVLVVIILRLLAFVIKGIVQSPRPVALQATLRQTFDGYGFPSGHTLTSTLLLGSLMFLIVRHVRGEGVTRIAVAVWALGAVLTAFARVWSGAHWASDVIGGAMLGVVMVMIAANVSAWAMTRDRWRMRDRITP